MNKLKFFIIITKTLIECLELRFFKNFPVQKKTVLKFILHGRTKSKITELKKKIDCVIKLIKENQTEGERNYN